MLNLSETLDIAVTIAKNAGALLVQEHQKFFEGGATLHVKTKSSPRDFVTEVDANVQKAIIQEIQSHFPTHTFVAEEEGADTLGDPQSPYRWIIDPLDGTTNFIHGKPNFGTILALQEHEQTVLGVIYCPLLNHLYYGAKGQGVFADGKPVKLRNTKSLDDATLCCNLIHRSYACTNGDMHVPVILCASVENYGNAAQEFGEVLLGYNDGVFFSGPKLWDIAAGCFLIEEAGGKAHYELKDSSDPRSGVWCAASTAPIFDELDAFVFSPSFQRKE